MSDRDIAAEVDAHLRATIIDFPTWSNRVKNGFKGKPYDGSKTEWGKAFAGLAQIGAVAQPPPPGGTTREAHTIAEALTAISASKAGDVVYVRAGTYGKLTLQQDFLGAKILCEAGSQFAGVDTNGTSGYSFEGLRSVLPPEFVDYNIAAFYCHGSSKQISLKGGYLEGGYLCFKQYDGAGQADQITLDSVEAAKAGGDITHWDGIQNATLTDVYLHDPLQGGSEHPDAIQVQRCAGTMNIVRPRLECMIATPRDRDGQGIFLRAEPDTMPLGTIIVDSPSGKWNAGRFFQAYTVDYVIVKNPNVSVSGDGQTAPFTLGPTIRGRVDLYGMTSSQVYVNGGTDTSRISYH